MVSFQQRLYWLLTLSPVKAILPLLQVELQQAETASEDKAAALQADIADLQEHLAAAEADLAAAQARVQQLEQQLQAQQAEAAATEKRMKAQMEQLKMDVSCSPLCCTVCCAVPCTNRVLCCTMHILCDTFCFCICLLMPCVSPLNLGAEDGSEGCFSRGRGLCLHSQISGIARIVHACNL